MRARRNTANEVHGNGAARHSLEGRAGGVPVRHSRSAAQLNG